MDMKVAFIGNTAWLDEELSTLRLLSAGLASRGVELLGIVPEWAANEPDLFAGGQTLVWHETGWAMLRSARLTGLRGELGRANVGLIHVLDRSLWAGGLALASALRVPVVLQCESIDDGEQLELMEAAIRHHGAALIATTEPIAQAARRHLGAAVTIELIRPGAVLAEDRPSADSAAAIPIARADPGAICAAVCGSGPFDDDCEALLAAIRSVVDLFPQAQFFLDGLRSDQHQLWQAAQRHALLSNLSLVPRRYGHRELLLRADVVIHPQPSAHSRAVTLQAMALGLPVIARQDPWLDYLVDDQTAWLVRDANPASWTAFIRRIIEEPRASAELGQRARQWARTHHDPVRQVTQTHALYTSLTGGSLKFPGAGA